jgi:low affinity Fe/Cu permease
VARIREQLKNCPVGVGAKRRTEDSSRVERRVNASPAGKLLLDLKEMPPMRKHGRRASAATKMRNATRGRARPLGRALEHPADRIEDRRGGFDSFAQRASHLVSSPLFFVVCVGLVLAWAIGLAVGASDRFEAAAVGLMSSATLILVAVLKNSELRTERALQTKLDAIAGSLLEDRRGHRGDAEDELERSIRIQEQI